MDVWTKSLTRIKGIMDVRVRRIGKTESAEKVVVNDLKAILGLQEKQCALSGRMLTTENVFFTYKIPLESGGMHTKKNILLVSHEVSIAKGEMTDDEFTALCRDVAGHREEIPCP